MRAPTTGDDAAVRLMLGLRTWAVVGLSPDPHRDSHRIAALLQRRGHRIVPVNPLVEEVLGERAWPSLADVPAGLGVEVVDVFRRSSLPALTSTRRSRSARGASGCSSASSTRQPPRGRGRRDSPW